MSFMTVVLPQPEGPTMASMPDGGTEKHTSRSTGLPGTYENVT